MKNTHHTIGTNVIPNNYNMSIEPDLKSFTFRGKEIIKIDIKSKTNRFKINSKELKIREAKIRTGTLEQNVKFKFDIDNEEVLLSFPKAIAGHAELSIVFEGKSNDELYGFYRTKYTYEGKIGYNLSSQFESTNARAAFPCFDEPAFKATFDVTLVIDDKLDAISNMPIKNVVKAGKLKKSVTFYTSPKMSSYLLYLGVGKYEYLEDSVGKVKFRVITTPGKIKTGKIAMKYAKKFFSNLEGYFGIKYPLPKIDFIAIPDFAAGAMENWGALTFRDAEMLGVEEKTAIIVKQRILEVIAHELTHQWFGDLVTMQWWDDMWLNESFAEFMGYRTVAAVAPEIQNELKFYEDILLLAFTADEETASHPISAKANTIAEIEELFDDIGYRKGGAVLYMLQDYVGREIFRKGLHRYLKQNMYSNAVQTDLWNAVAEEVKLSGKPLPVAEIMKAWVTKLGYPVVNIRKVAGGFELEQKRFTLTENNDKNTWPIPIHYITSEGEGRTLMKERKHVIKSSGNMIKLNYEQAGLYRVRYEDALLDNVGELMRTKELNSVDGWGVEFDLYTFTKTGRIKLDRYLDFIRKYCINAEYPMSFNLSAHLSTLLKLSRGEKFEEKIRKVSLSYHRALLERTGIEMKEGEDVITTRTRGNALAGLALAEDPKIVNLAISKFNDHIENGTPLDPNLKSVFYITAVQHSKSEKLFNKLLKMYKTEKLPEDQLRAISVLGMFDDVKLVRKALDVGISNKVRYQDSYKIPASCAWNPNAKPILVKWVMQHWKKLLKYYPVSIRMLYIYTVILSTMTDIKSRNEIERFFKMKSNQREDITKDVLKMLEQIDINMKFLETNR